MWLLRTDRKGAWKVLMGTFKRTSLRGRRKISWEDNININVEEIERWSRNVLICLRIGKSGEVCFLIGDELPAFNTSGNFLTS